MSSGTTYNTTTGASWVDQVWDNEIDSEAYEASMIRKYVAEKKPGHGTYHIRKHANLTPSTTANLATQMDEPVFSANTETEFTMTPGWVDLNLSLTDPLLKRMSTDPTDTLRTSIEAAFAQKIDQDLATLFVSFVTNISGSYAADIDKAKVLDIKSKVHAGAKQYGDDEIHLFYHHLQDDAILTVDSFVNAMVRGSGEKGAVTGRVGTGFGLQFHRTGAIRNSGGGFNNGAIIQRAIALSFNQRVNVASQRHGKATWLLGGTDYMYGAVRDAYCGLLKSQAA